MTKSISEQELIEDDVLIQAMNLQLHKWKAMLASGQERVGWKIGFNTLADQERMHLSSPIIGFLTSKSLLENDGAYKAKAASKIMLEAEIAILIGQDVPAGADKAQLAAAIEGFAPAIEIVDVARTPHDITSILEDNLFHEAVILGPVSREHPGLAARDVDAKVFINQENVQSGDPSRYPEDITEIVSVVADTLARQGESLQAGDWIISGSITKPVAVQAGDQIEVSLLPLGTLSAEITE
ncbi:2-keto-4-pentenoate hydratase [Sulfuriflexus mobilis]|uniref:2-keto-4-pentenoate hydratase n=1 Tax=Sulfuriflexus mobilis TaxID=1811807 RepID=UPI000F82D652|nr:fumarylacetoacetate hydrolase family protein [Sulfuriflexus mobilis]